MSDQTGLKVYVPASPWEYLPNDIFERVTGKRCSGVRNQIGDEMAMFALHGTVPFMDGKLQTYRDGLDGVGSNLGDVLRGLKTVSNTPEKPDHFKVRDLCSIAEVKSCYFQWTIDGVFVPRREITYGNLRFICFAVICVMAEKWGWKKLFFLRPEAGLNPRHIALVAGMLKSLSASVEVTICTESTAFLNELQPNDLRLWKDNKSHILKSLDALNDLLEGLKLGEAWEQNYLDNDFYLEPIND